MRRVLVGDLLALAQDLVMRPEQVRRTWALGYLDDAHVADVYRKKTQRAHPLWGDGSVMGRVLIGYGPRGVVDFSDPDFCHAFSVGLEALAVWRSAQEKRRKRGRNR